MSTEAVIPGPYWVRTSTNGKHQVCGRSGATVREYMPHQMALADADCRRLQAGHQVAENALRDAAPELLRVACNMLAFAEIKWGNLDPDANEAFADARAAIASARGTAS